MKRRAMLLALAATLVSAVLCSSAAAVAPRADFFGLTTIERLNADYEAAEMEGLGTHTVRMDIAWGRGAGGCGAETASPVDFSYYDQVFRRAATHSITIIAALGRCNSRSYIDPFNPESAAHYTTWKVQPGPTWGGGFVWQVVQRYGVNGSFWSENPALPNRPVRVWEVGNEHNMPVNNPGGMVVNPQKYAKVLIDTSATIRAAQEAKAGVPVSATDTKVVIGGLAPFGEATSVASYFNQIYGSPNGYTPAQFHNAWDGLGWHPYALNGCALNGPGCEGRATMQKRVEEARTVLDTPRSALGGGSDAAKTLWLTELGWPVMFIAGEIDVSEATQAQFLRQGFNWIYANADALKVKVAAWYAYRDARGAKENCTSFTCWDVFAGLKRQDGSNRPSWNDFRLQTGGSGDWLRYWKLRNSLATGGADVSLPFALRSHRAVVGDWDGDGKDTVGVFAPGDATWHLRNSNTAGFPDHHFAFGTPTMLPIAGDWNGDGKDTIGLFVPNDSTWHFRNSLSGGFPDHHFGFGTSVMQPIAGDWNGDGKDTIGLFSRDDASWHLRESLSGGFPDHHFGFGTSAMLPIAGDWNGDGKDTVGLYSPNDSSFHLRNQLGSGPTDIHLFFERGGLTPLAGDWDGDGKDTVGLSG